MKKKNIGSEELSTEEIAEIKKLTIEDLESITGGANIAFSGKYEDDEGNKAAVSDGND